MELYVLIYIARSNMTSFVILVPDHSTVQIETFEVCSYNVWMNLFYIYRKTSSISRNAVFARSGRVRDVRECRVRTSSTRLSAWVAFSTLGHHEGK